MAADHLMWGMDFAHHILAGPNPSGIPNPGTGTAPPGARKILTILGWVAWVIVVGCVGGIMFAGVKMGLAHRRGDDSGIGHLGWVLFGCVVVGSASGIAGVLL